MIQRKGHFNFNASLSLVGKLKKQHTASLAHVGSSNETVNSEYSSIGWKLN